MHRLILLGAMAASCLTSGCRREPASQGTTRHPATLGTARTTPAPPVFSPDQLVAQLLALDTAAQFWPDLPSALSGYGNPGFEPSNGSDVVARYEVCPSASHGDTLSVAVHYGVLGTAIIDQTDGSWRFAPAPTWHTAVYRVTHGRVIVPEGELTHLSAEATVAHSEGINRDTLRAQLTTAGLKLDALAPPLSCDEQPN